MNEECHGTRDVTKRADVKLNKMKRKQLKIQLKKQIVKEVKT